MTEDRVDIPERTIESIARGVFKESAHYGFSQIDYIRFATHILQLANHEIEPSPDHSTCGRQYGDTDTTRLPIHGERIVLRAFNDNSDCALLTRWIDDEQGRYFLLSRTDAAVTTVEELIADPIHILSVIQTPDGKPIGCMAFLNYDQVQRKAEMRKLIGESSYRGRGLGKDASALWIAYGRLGLNLRKIYLSTLNTNVGNIKLNEDLGFEIEGIMRDELEFNGRTYDVLRMGCCLE